VIRAVSLDFANTLYPLRSRETEESLRRLHAFLQKRLGKPLEDESLFALYREIRSRQFTENRPSLRENDFTARIREMIEANLDGEPTNPSLIRECEQVYADSFVAEMRLPAGARETIARLAETYALAVLSNFPLTECILRPLERDGLLPFLQTVIVSADIGYIKPHPSLFTALCEGLGAAPAEIVHVGDDWDADILGATGSGLHAVYTTEWRDEPDPFYGLGPIAPLFEIARLRDLPDQLLRLGDD